MSFRSRTGFVFERRALFGLSEWQNFRSRWRARHFRKIINGTSCGATDSAFLAGLRPQNERAEAPVNEGERERGDFANRRDKKPMHVLLPAVRRL